MSSPALRAFRLVITLALVLTCGVSFAGCGSSSDDRALSKREYIQRGNRLQGDASKVFESLHGNLAATPAAAGAQLKAFDTLIAGYEELRPPKAWRDEHATMLRSLRAMRQSMSIVSKAPATNTAVITTQLARFNSAQRDFRQAVRDVNASR
ncbi:MAG: hypothetical protein JWM98_2320 [Thermoleophilia bacterium]|nr:hypothetical protein [Thermoleophilia bacterium]